MLRITPKNKKMKERPALRRSMDAIKTARIIKDNLVVKQNSSAIKLIRYWVPVILYAALIFAFSAMPGKNLPQLFPHADTLFHFLEYIGFSLLIIRAIKAYQPEKSIAARTLIVFLIGFIYAVSDELHQIYVPGRTASFLDLASDSLGILMANIFIK